MIHSIPRANREPPHSVEAEEFLLSGLLLDGEKEIGRCIESGLPPAVFYSPANRVIYERVCEMHRRGLPVDVAVLSEELKATGQLEIVGGVPYLAQISGRVPTTAQSTYFIGKVRDLYLLRELARVASATVEQCREHEGEIRPLVDRVLADYAAVGKLCTVNPIVAELSACLFDPQVELEKPRVVYRLGGRAICTEGNLATIIAQAKAGKSAFVGAFISAAVTRSDTIDALGITGRNHAEGAVLHFDTEQSPHDHSALLRRALARADREAWPTWFRSYQFSGKPPDEARVLMDYAFEQSAREIGGIHSVLVDGVADLVLDVNDPKESFPFVTHLHAQALKYRTAIISVLHLNPGTQIGKTRGHLGSQLERKAETNLLLEKDGQTTVVWSEKQRGAPISKAEGPRFRWDDAAGMHTSCETVEATKDAAKRERLKDQAESAFLTAKQSRLAWGSLVGAIATAEGIGKSGATKRFDAMKALGVVVRDATGMWSLAS